MECEGNIKIGLKTVEWILTVLDTVQQQALLSAIKNFPCVQRLHERLSQCKT